MSGVYDPAEEASAFLSALARKALPDDERLITAGFVGDPNADMAHAWRPRPWRPGDALRFHPLANVYVSISSFGRAPDGGFRRKNDCFKAGHAIMVDDVGVGFGSKISYETMAGAPPPTAVVETSSGNFQWWYMLTEPERDVARFGGVIDAFISCKLLGHDPGMGGAARVGRVPGFTNGKARHNGWRVRLQELRPEARYTLDELVKAFGLKVAQPRPRASMRLLPESARERPEAFLTTWRWLRARGMLKEPLRPDAHGWWQITCPWVSEHTGRADNGAALREPAPENAYWGGFRCFHSGCAGRGLRQLTDWINDLAAEELSTANDAALPWEATSTSNTLQEVKQDE